MKRIRILCNNCQQPIETCDEQKARLVRDLVAARRLIEDLRQSVSSATSGYMRFLDRLMALDPAFQTNADYGIFTTGEDDGRTNQTQAESPEAS